MKNGQEATYSAFPLFWMIYKEWISIDYLFLYRLDLSGVNDLPCLFVVPRYQATTEYTKNHFKLERNSKKKVTRKMLSLCTISKRNMREFNARIIRLLCHFQRIYHKERYSFQMFKNIYRVTYLEKCSTFVVKKFKRHDGIFATGNWIVFYIVPSTTTEISNSRNNTGRCWF